MKLIRLLLLCCLPWSFNSWGAAGDIEGRWLSHAGNGWIDIRVEGQHLIGVIAGYPEGRSGNPQLYDIHNPDPDLRSRPLLGLAIMTGLTYEGDGLWVDGTVYDPESGKTYRCRLALVDVDTIEVRGYIGLPLLGRSDTWTREGHRN